MCGCATNQAVNVQSKKKIVAEDKTAQPPKAAQLPSKVPARSKQSGGSKDSKAKQAGQQQPSKKTEQHKMEQQSQQYLASEIKKRSDRLRVGQSKKSSESRIRVKDLGRKPIQIPEKYVKLDDDVVQQLYVKPMLKKKQIADVVI